MLISVFFLQACLIKTQRMLNVLEADVPPWMTLLRWVSDSIFRLAVVFMTFINHLQSIVQ
jgi:hypothetical protein